MATLPAPFDRAPSRLVVGEDDFAVWLTPPALTRSTALVLLHGGGMSAQSFARLAATVESVFALVAFDQRGHGA